MMDEIFDRTYQQSRQVMNESIDSGLSRLWRQALAAFAALDGIQYSSPWAGKPRRIPRDA